MAAMITIELPDDLTTALEAEAREAGVPVETIVERIVRAHVAGRAGRPAPITPALPWDEFMRRMSEGVEGPGLPASAYTRESFYEDEQETGPG